MRTVNGWINDLDITKTWIETESDSKRGLDGQLIVMKIRCKICAEFRSRLKNVRNFSDAFINGITGSSLKRDNLSKHSTSVMHLHALRMKEQPTFSVDMCLKTTTIMLVYFLIKIK
jgi:hypothetical protein